VSKNFELRNRKPLTPSSSLGEPLCLVAREA